MKKGTCLRNCFHGLIVLAVIVSLFGGVFAPSREAQAASPTIIYVDANASGLGNGTSWTNAFTGLQSAIDAANTSSGTTYEIWVAAGTYSGTGAFTLQNGVAIYGGFAGGETDLSQRDSNPVTNGAVLNGGGTHTVVTAGASTDSSAVLDGFTVTGGNATDSGGGMAVYGSPKLSNLAISSNTAASGGGMYVYGGSPALTNVLFRANTANIGGGMYVASDGSTTASPTLVNVAFVANAATGGSTPWGGGMFVQNVSNVTLTNVSFGGNTAGLGGGILAMGGSTTVNARNSVFWGNTDTSGDSVAQQQIYAVFTPVTVSYSDVQGSGGSGSWTLAGVTNGGNNIDSDPKFANLAGGDLRLKYGSGVVDKGNNGFLPAGITKDLGGFPRFVDGDGNGTATVDMGAYERIFRYYVRAGAPAGGDGTSWATAFTNLPSALTTAEPISQDDPHEVIEVWVAGGTYSPGSADTFTLKNAVAIYGGFPAGGGNWGTRNPVSNATVLDGGGVANHVVTAPSDVSSSGLLDGFTITGGNAVDSGGGMLVYGSPTVSSVVFKGNTASGNGGGLQVASGSPLLVNLTFYNNSANSGGGVYVSGGTPMIANSILWGDSATTGQEIYEQGGTSTVEYSDVQGGWTGTGNINSDPLFVNAASGDLTLQAHSPAIDAGSDGLVPTGTLVSFSSPVRFRDDPGTLPNVSACSNAPVDMGAYEFQGVTPVDWSVIYVREGATSGTRSGQDWDNAFTDLQSALLLANSGQEIHVAAGTYYPTCQINHNASFWMKPGVKIYGGYPAGGGDTRDWTTNVTILSGDINGNDTSIDTINSTNRSEDCYHVVRADGTVGSSAVLDGFTIEHGNANYGDDSYGGGIYITGAGSPTLANLIISDNMAAEAGGVYLASGNPALTNITFSGNRAEGGPGGGGLYMDGGSPVLTDVTFTGNKAADVVSGGGAIYEAAGSPTLTDVTITNNSSDGSGGGMLVEQGNPTLTNVRFTGNTSQVDGAGMYIGYDSATLTNVAFVGNSSESFGGGILDYASNITLTNVTFSGNSAAVSGGALSVFGQPACAPPQNCPPVPGSATLTNCILWGNTSPGTPEIHVDGRDPATATVSYSDVEGSGGSGSWVLTSVTDGGHNIDSDPLFVSSTDVHLQGSPAASPAIDAGNNAAVSVDTDLDGNARIYNGTVDMGPYEYGSAPETSAPQITSSSSITFTVGSSGTFTVTSTGTPTATITETGSLPAGVNFTDNGDGTATLSGTPDAGSGGVYPLTITAANGTLPDATQSFTLTVNEAPSVTTDPQDVTKTAGETATFTAAASGYPEPTVQWQQLTTAGGAIWTDMPGETSATLSVSSVNTDMDGYQYRTVFSNAAGTSNSNPATLTVTPATTAPQFTSFATATFTAGSFGLFSVTTTGNPIPWVGKTGSMPSGVDFSPNSGGGATIVGTPASHSGGLYPLTLTAANGILPDATQNFTLTVNEAPSITADPQDQTVTEGGTATFTAAASGYPEPAVQWQILGTGVGATWANMLGETSTTLSLTDVPISGNGYQYRAVFSNGIGSPTTTAAATLTVNPATTAPQITSADSITFTVGTSGAFTVTTTGIPTATITETGTLPAGVNFTDNGDGTATLSGTPDAGSGGVYPLTITAANGTLPDATQSLTLMVNEAPQITSATIAEFVEGEPDSFTLSTSGYPTPTISLDPDGIHGLSFTDDGDGTGTISGTAAANSFGDTPVTITAANGVAPTATQTLTISISQKPSVNTQPGSQTVTEGSDVTFGTAGSGWPVPTAQWQVSTDGGNTYADIAGETGGSLDLHNVTLSMNGNQYRAVYTNKAGTATSNVATLTVSPATNQVDVSISPAGGGTVDPGSGQYAGSTEFTATANSGYKFKNWTVDGVTQTGNPLTIDITAPTTVVANFTYTAFTVVSPNGGETLKAGTPYKISWTALSGAKKYNVRYSTNWGKTWSYITYGTTNTKCNWITPKVNSNKTGCLVEVLAYDGKGNQLGRDRSDSSFSINKIVSVTAPNGGEKLNSGTFFNIKWETYQPPRAVGSVDILLSANGGYSYSKITTVPGNPGSYSWKVPRFAQAKPYCIVKVVLKDKLGQTIASDVSDSFFTISNVR